MRKHRAKIILIVGAVLLSLYLLYPTYQDYGFRQSLGQLSGEDSLGFIEENEMDIRDARTDRIKLGLDLQGGMRVVLEVNVLKLIEDLAKNKDATFTDILEVVKGEVQQSEESPVLILRRNFEERQIRMSRYYGSLRDDNDRIYGFLENESE
ncbi:MAG: protein translocase subunit SecD, partial [Bacteroidota bacterium]